MKWNHKPSSFIHNMTFVTMEIGALQLNPCNFKSVSLPSVSRQVCVLVNLAMEHEEQSRLCCRLAWLAVQTHSPLLPTFQTRSISRVCGFFLYNGSQFWQLLPCPARSLSLIQATRAKIQGPANPQECTTTFAQPECLLQLELQVPPDIRTHTHHHLSPAHLQ